MSPKTYLNQIKRLEESIDQKIAELTDLRLDAQTVRGLNYDSDHIQTSANKDAPYARTLERIDDLRRQTAQQIEELSRARSAIIGQVQGIQDARYASLLYKRYVTGATLDQIAAQMQYSAAHIRHLHGGALQAFGEQWGEEIEEYAKMHTQSHV